jgi:hypothetical protein
MTEDLFDRVQEFLEKKSHYNYRYPDFYIGLKARLCRELEQLVKYHFEFQIFIMLGDVGDKSLLFSTKDIGNLVSYDKEKFKSKEVFLGHIMKDFIFGCSDPGA